VLFTGVAHVSDYGGGGGLKKKNTEKGESDYFGGSIG